MRGEEIIEEKLCRAACPSGWGQEEVAGRKAKIKKRGKRDSLHSFTARGRVVKSKNRGDPVKFKFLG